MENVLYKIHGTIYNLALLMRNTHCQIQLFSTQHLINYAVAQTMRIVNLKAQASVSTYTMHYNRVTVLIRSIQTEFLWLHVEHYNKMYVHVFMGGAPHVPQSVFAPHLHLGYFSNTF